MVLDDSKALAWPRVPPVYIPMTWQDTVNPLKSRAIFVFWKCMEKTLQLPNVQREPWSYLRSGLPQAPALTTSPVKAAVGINKDLLATHIAGCPTRTELGKVSSRKHSASPPGLLHLLSWEWGKGGKQDHSYSSCRWQAHCCLSCR